ncbi:MAG: hypothetical protein HUJ25_03665 [Crocinitomicaceae bacterium]|nr:hypothetical protein [Crocinitomicaceae bacterium]
MKNTVISYANLSKELKQAFSRWLRFSTPELISFPFKGMHMKGYIFNHDEQNYLVVMQLQHNNEINVNLENLDIYEEF